MDPTLIVTGDNKARLEDVSNEMQGVRSKMSDVVQALRRLEDDMKQVERRKFLHHVVEGFVQRIILAVH